MKEIGGYFELEIYKSSEYYGDAIKLNTARNAIKYILRAQNVKTVYVPYLTCESVIEPIKASGVYYRFYSIDDKLEVTGMRPEMLHENDKLLYINYFGVKNAHVDTLAERFGSKLIVDNTQAFYKEPVAHTDTCYSPRKFFGLPDGGYLYTDTMLDEELEKDVSYERCRDLLGRIDTDAATFYAEYVKHNESLIGLPLKKMSTLTQTMLASIDYEKARLTRERNYRYLHDRLNALNALEIDHADIHGPMVYPLLIETEGLREYLISEKIYVATYWKEVLDFVERPGTVEEKMVRYLLPIPIDQRYGSDDMERIASTVKKYLDAHGGR